MTCVFALEWMNKSLIHNGLLGLFLMNYIDMWSWSASVILVSLLAQKQMIGQSIEKFVHVDDLDSFRKKLKSEEREVDDTQKSIPGVGKLITVYALLVTFCFYSHPLKTKPGDYARKWGYVVEGKYAPKRLPVSFVRPHRGSVSLSPPQRR